MDDFEYIRKHYNVPAEVGRRVAYTGGDYPQDGVITGAKGTYIMVHLKGEPHPVPMHPLWELTYSTKGPLVPVPAVKKQSRSAARYQEYLDADSGLSFRAWLGIGKKRRSA